MSPCPLCAGERARRLRGTASASPLYRCLQCRAVHWGDEWNGEAALDYYRDYYAGKPVEYDPITEQRYHVILARLERLTRPGKLLDVGCGMGHFLAVTQARGWQAVGLEVAESGLELLERVRRERGWRFEIQGGDLLVADLPLASFKAVTLFEVLEHLTHPEAYLRKIHALLEPGGVFYLTTPNFDSLSRYLLGHRWRAITVEHRCLFNPRTLRDCLRAAGFAPVAVVTKNVDVPEIAAKWRRPRPRPSGTSTFAQTRAFRRTLEGSPWLRAAKSATNAVLRMTRLGETIEALAVKTS